MAIDSSSVLGFGLAWGVCSAVLPFYDPVLGSVSRSITTIQPALGLGTNVRTGTLLASVTAGRPLLAEAILRRIVTPRGTLPDVEVPTTTGNYGVDIASVVFADFTARDAGELSARIDAQAGLDERVQSSVTTSTIAGDILVVSVNLVDGAGPFRLTVSINTITQDISILSSPN